MSLGFGCFFFNLFRVVLILKNWLHYDFRYFNPPCFVGAVAWYMGSNFDVMETFGHSARSVISCNKMFLFNTAGFLVFFQRWAAQHVLLKPGTSTLTWIFGWQGKEGSFAGCSLLKIQQWGRERVFTFQYWRPRMMIGGRGNITRARDPNLKQNHK